jgi:hypothetical protein
MKNLLKLVALALFAVALSGAALAQDDAQVVRADIPFSSYAGGHLLPAGEYTILVNPEHSLVTIEQKATGREVFLLSSADDSSRDARPVLIFKLVGGGAYALRELQGPDLGVSFNANGPRSATRAQNQKNQSVEVIAEAK